MGRIYVKIFLGFWLATILMMLSSNAVIHWFNLGPDKHLPTQENTNLGDRLLRELVSDAINYNYEEVELGLQAMPSWATRYFILVNERGEDMLGRPVSPMHKLLLLQLTAERPYFKKHLTNKYIYGRRFQLSDGHTVQLLSYPPLDQQSLGWRLFFNNFWNIALLNMLISGAACFYLARYITRDINTLKEATQRLAKGDWNVRVSDSFCGRPGEMADLGKAFDDMATQLRGSMLEQKRLIKDVSHELRSPLARLQVALAIAQQRANAEVTGELDRIKEAADYLNDVISDILSLPINEQGEWELNDVIEISSLLETVVNACRDEAQQKGVELVFSSTVDELLVMTRGNTLVGVFDNIIRNAIHYTIENTAVTIALRLNDDKNPEVQVSDRGPGVEQEHLSDIFEPFFRTDEARDRKSGGYGLGLSIAQRTVELHGGHISAHNNREQDPQKSGLSITLDLPASQLDD